MDGRIVGKTSGRLEVDSFLHLHMLEATCLFDSSQRSLIFEKRFGLTSHGAYNGGATPEPLQFVFPLYQKSKIHMRAIDGRFAKGDGRCWRTGYFSF